MPCLFFCAPDGRTAFRRIVTVCPQNGHNQDFELRDVLSPSMGPLQSKTAWSDLHSRLVLAYLLSESSNRQEPGLSVHLENKVGSLNQYATSHRWLGWRWLLRWLVLPCLGPYTYESVPPDTRQEILIPRGIDLILRLEI